ncbi:MAG: 30S ribosomal protein S13 [Candidatus Blackburnbacteria bacterium]|nr:30S ribosomal protein S13 [Candidatus Blackburnbacteria bacterium]
MARISGIDLPENKRIDYALTLIYGIGWALSKKILLDINVAEEKRVHDLSEEDISKISKAVENYLVEGDLKRNIRQNIQRLQAVGTYRGVRHSKNLPVRGQRTKSNGRTKRGKRKTVGAFKKEMLAKQTAAKPAPKK